LSKEALASVKLYDIDGYLVRSLVSKRSAKKGYNTIKWDGKDDAANYLPAGAFTYLIEAISLDSKETVFYDLTDQTFGKELTLRSLSYDDKTGKIEYVLPKAAMLRIRAGIKEGGPLLATLIDWQPQQAGRHQYLWSGKIGLDDVDLKSHPNVEFNLTTYSLPENSILIKYTNPQPNILPKVQSSSAKRRTRATSPFKKYLHATHPRAKCREPRFAIEFPHVSEYADDGAPIVSGVVPVRIIIDKQDKKLLQDERYEIVFFVDFVFLYEEEEGISPFTYFFDTKGMSEGRHLITVNVYGFKDHIGTETRSVDVKRAK
jgi:hypothetical protein